MTLTWLEWILLALVVIGWSLFFIAYNHAWYWKVLCREREEQLKKSRRPVEVLREKNRE